MSKDFDFDNIFDVETKNSQCLGKHIKRECKINTKALFKELQKRLTEHPHTDSSVVLRNAIKLQFEAAERIESQRLDDAVFAYLVWIMSQDIENLEKLRKL